MLDLNMLRCRAACFGDIKAVRNGPNASIDIYDLSKNVAEAQTAK